MKISFFTPLKISWSLIWRTTIFGTTIAIWGYIIFVFLLFGLLTIGYTETINLYISNYNAHLKAFVTQQTFLTFVLSSLFVYGLLAIIYYFPFRKLNHLSYKNFTLHFYKRQTSAPSGALFLAFYTLFRVLDLTFFLIFSSMNLEILSDIIEILALILTIYLFCRFQIFGYHFYLTPNRFKNLGNNTSISVA
ncbi:MAG TPA: hypothetical protein VNJ29_00140 [Candidatus Nitrosotenuis sp.]|jgi:magnesium-transporting ATPase (P-type)|nr:hypothetical protein [Candidatus Nitrosotenuis sp.]